MLTCRFYQEDAFIEVTDWVSGQRQQVDTWLAPFLSPFLYLLHFFFPRQADNNWTVFHDAQMFKRATFLFIFFSPSLILQTGRWDFLASLASPELLQHMVKSCCLSQQWLLLISCRNESTRHAPRCQRVQLSPGAATYRHHLSTIAHRHHLNAAARGSTRAQWCTWTSAVMHMGITRMLAHVGMMDTSSVTALWDLFLKTSHRLCSKN